MSEIELKAVDLAGYADQLDTAMMEAHCSMDTTVTLAMDFVESLVDALRTPATPDAVIERARVLLFNGGEDASLNLQGALHDLENRWKPDDGGVCARTIGRVIDQLEAFRRVIDAREGVG